MSVSKVLVMVSESSDIFSHQNCCSDAF